MTQKEEADRLYKRIYISGEDLRMAAEFAAFILKKGWHFDPWERRGTIYLQQSAFTSSLIVFYSRPFTRSKGLPEFPKRLLKYGDEENELHDTIIQLRHKVYAHSDDTSYKVQPFSINGYPAAILGAPFFKLAKPEVEMLQRMIEKTIKEIHGELAQLIRKIETPIGIGSSLAATPSHTTGHTGPYPAIRLIRTDTDKIHLCRRALFKQERYQHFSHCCNMLVRTCSLIATIIYPSHSVGHRSGLRWAESSAITSGCLAARLPSTTMPSADFCHVMVSPYGSVSPLMDNAADLPG